MTDSKFERIGVNLQYDATTIKEANEMVCRMLGKEEE